jgi:hypothetical protein
MVSRDAATQSRRIGLACLVLTAVQGNRAKEWVTKP